MADEKFRSGTYHPCSVPAVNAVNIGNICRNIPA